MGTGRGAGGGDGNPGQDGSHGRGLMMGGAFSLGSGAGTGGGLAGAAQVAEVRVSLGQVLCAGQAQRGAQLAGDSAVELRAGWLGFQRQGCLPHALHNQTDE